MKPSIAIIGHAKRIQTIKDVAPNYSENMTFDYISLNKLPLKDDLINLVRHVEETHQGIIFTGHTLYDMLITDIMPSVPWDYLRRDDQQLYRALLRSMIHDGRDITKVSIDSYPVATVERVYRAIGFDSLPKDVHIAPTKIPTNRLTQDLTSFHLNHFRDGKVVFSITGMANVADILASNQCPAMTLNPSHDVVNETIHRLQLRNKAIKNKISQIVILAIRIDNEDSYSIKYDDDYSYHLDRMNVTREIYQFARLVDGVVTEENRLFLIFTTRRILERETDQHKNLALLGEIEHHALRTVSIGIGYGDSVRQAKQHAILGMETASKRGGNAGYVVYSRDDIVGPVLSDPQKRHEDEIIIDQHFYRIAEDTDLSINTIYKLYTITIGQNRDTFTPKELADTYGVTPRSMNRIIEKLILSGYASIIGSRVIGSSGRPSRIIRLDFKSVPNLG